jgi:hypothetical protein
MSQQHIEIAVRQQAAIHDLQGPGHPMTSPYLNHVRSAREIIEELIAREIELAKTSAAVQRQRSEADLTFLRNELVRLDGEAEPGAGLCDTATQDKRIRDECSR